MVKGARDVRCVPSAFRVLTGPVTLKQRDFESKDFEVICSPDCRMHIMGDPTTRAVTLQTRRGFRGNKDGKDETALALIKANPTLSGVKLCAVDGVEVNTNN